MAIRQIVKEGDSVLTKTAVRLLNLMTDLHSL